MELLFAHIQPETIEAGYSLTFAFPTNPNDEYGFPPLRFVPGQQVSLGDGELAMVVGIRLIFSRYRRRDGSAGTLRFPPHWEYCVKDVCSIWDGKWMQEDEINPLQGQDEF